MRRSKWLLLWTASLTFALSAAACGDSGGEANNGTGHSGSSGKGKAGSSGKAGASGKGGAGGAGGQGGGQGGAGAGGGAGLGGSSAGSAGAAAQGGGAGSGTGPGGSAGSSDAGGSAGSSDAGASGQGGDAGAAGSSGAQGCATKNCNDGIPCTIDSCDEATGDCQHQLDDLSCDNGNVCDGNEVCTPSGCVTKPLDLSALSVFPAQSDLVYDGSSLPSVSFDGILDGVVVTQCLNWSLDNTLLGDLTGATFKANGQVGGKGTVKASVGLNKAATATVTVTLKQTNTNGLPPDQIALFDNPSGPDPSLALIYPNNNTIFPLGVLPPELHWGGGGGELYKLTITEQFYQYTEYFSAPAASRIVLADEAWQKLGQSGQGAKSDPVTVGLQRASGGTAFSPVSQTWKIAQGSLAGSLYYWELPDACGSGKGRILKINPGSTTAVEPFPTDQCYGCHTVSRDGKKMLAAFDNGSPFPLKQLDLSVSPSTVTPTSYSGTFAAFNDKGDKILFSTDGANGDRRLAIADANNGQVLNSNLFNGNACGEPAWSPDGTRIAAICNLQGGGWIFDATGGELVTATMGPDGIGVGQPTTIGTTGQGRPAYPSFSPNSEWLAFGRPTTGSRSVGNGELWITNMDGSTQRKLATATGDNRSFNPVFAPIRAGGYFWIAFMSRRDYGNVLVGSNRQQLWITAIEDPPTADDPSAPAFYVRGQENCAKSENVYFALDPCKNEGEGCKSGIDCCGGSCIKSADGSSFICGKPPENTCSIKGNACKTTPDCCEGDEQLQCIDGFCQSNDKP